MGTKKGTFHKKILEASKQKFENPDMDYLDQLTYSSYNSNYLLCQI